MNASIFAVAAMLLAQSAATSVTPNAPPAPVQGKVAALIPPGAAEPGKLICRSVTETGTRFSHKACYTAAQWSQITAASRDLADDMQTRGNGYSH